MKKIIIVLIASLMANIAVASPNLMVTTEVYYNDLADMYGQHVFITSQEDSIKINRVTINRGNCRIGTPSYNYLVNLKFGQRVRVTPLVTCNVVEVTVETNKGTETYQWF